MGKYDPIEQVLDNLTKNGQTEWNATFSKVENLLGFKLPKSARTYPEWWANEDLSYTQKSQCRAWARAGWKTAFVNLNDETLTFVRPRALAKRETETNVTTEKSLTINMSWRMFGHAEIDHKMRLQFPPMPNSPGVYRIRVKKDEDDFEYIGEADNLKRRFQHYRTPGPTQVTNRRLNALMFQTLSDKNKVTVECVETATINIAQSYKQADFKQRHVRVLIEAAALHLNQDSLTLSLNL